VRTNVEDEWLAGNGPDVLARVMSWHRQHAIGNVTLFWRNSQAKMVCSGTEDMIKRHIAADSDDEEDKLFQAYIRVGVVELTDDGLYRIPGNEKHIANLKRLKDRQRHGTEAAAKAAAKKRSERATGRGCAKRGVKKTEQDHHVADRPTPESSAGVQTTAEFGSHNAMQCNTMQIRDPNTIATQVASPSRTVPSRKGRTPEQKARSIEVNHLYVDLYRVAYGHPPAAMAAAENAKIAHFADHYGDNANAIVRQFFASPSPEYRASGYSIAKLVVSAEKLWSEACNPMRAVEHLAAPVAARQQARRANNALVFDRVFGEAG
jgi:hypothetical protein